MSVGRKDFAYAEISPEACVPLGKELLSEGVNWHFHGLYTGCAFNPRPSQFAFLIEDITNRQNYCAFMKVSPKWISRQLAPLLNGPGLLDAGAGRSLEAQNAIIVKTARSCSDAGEPWHHHHFRPDCVLNPEPGHYVLAVEHGDPGKLLTQASDAKPLEVLKELELLYFEMTK